MLCLQMLSRFPVPDYHQTQCWQYTDNNISNTFSGYIFNLNDFAVRTPSIKQGRRNLAGSRVALRVKLPLTLHPNKVWLIVVSWNHCTEAVVRNVPHNMADTYVVKNRHANVAIKASLLVFVELHTYKPEYSNYIVAPKSITRDRNSLKLIIENTARDP